MAIENPTTTADFFFELGVEELPSHSVKPLSESLAHHLVASFSKAMLTHGKVQVFASPRRLAVWIEQVQAMQPDQTIARRGPAFDEKQSAQHPSQALLGFAKSCGVCVQDLKLQETDKGTWWAYETIKPGKQTKDLLPELVQEAINNIAIPKPMRWGSEEIEFVRPVHWVILLYGDECISTSILGVPSGRMSFGHRFHHPASVSVACAKDYEGTLKAARVIADFETRRNKIVNDVQQLAAQKGLTPVMPETLVDEVTSIVEWPCALLGQFDTSFLEVPEEVLIASMQSHQKCFALRDASNALQAYFITVANIESIDPQQVIRGNEKVIHARLSDAAFFYQQDKKQSLAAYQEQLGRVVLQAGLGSLEDKTKRLQHLMHYLAPLLGLQTQQALRAAQLSQCDLVTGMVGEFPELQGVMGYYYALNDGEPQEVALALKEQYMPRFAADALPQSSLGIALSLADRLDTLVGAFSIGQKPTGMKDPFKLRRHALAVVRLLVHISTPINLSALIEQAFIAYGKPIREENILSQLKPFILERMQSYYQSQEVPAHVVQAVRMRQDEWLYDADKRISALIHFIQEPAAAALSAASKRVTKLLEQRIAADNLDTIDPSLLEQDAEKILWDKLQNTNEQINSSYRSGEYITILCKLSELREPVDAFFDSVMVMVEDKAVRENRLRLLAKLQNLLQGVADISLCV